MSGPASARHGGSRSRADGWSANAAQDRSHNGHRNGHGNGSPSTAALVSQAATQISTLVRSELALAKAELSEKAKQFGLGGGLLAGAGILGGFGFALLLVLAVVLLDLVWPLWAAVLTVMLACFVIAGLAAAFGRSKLTSAAPAVPETASSLRQDLSVVRDAFHDGRHPDERWYRYEGPSGDPRYERDYARHGYADQAHGTHQAHGAEQAHGGHTGRHAYDDRQYGEHSHGGQAYDERVGGHYEQGGDYRSSEAGWGTQIHSADDDRRGEGWR